ncbi:MAG: NAD(P)-dependent oxidoreductase [Planctomycetes bacterium SCN 63-9]|nr:MAG: NAD(P)-dependent oxidoreductase [Planctomycetes bacterium SCN 63-9]
MRIVVTGASGQLGAYLVDHLESTGTPVHAWGGRSPRNPLRHPESIWRSIDLTQGTQTLEALEAANPEIILHLAAISAADAVFNAPKQALAVNVTATRLLADWCAERDRRLIFTSTDLVFDGTRSHFREEDSTNPLLAYGRTKVEAEQAVLSIDRGLVARMSLMFGFSKSARQGFFDRAIHSMKQGIPQTFFEDEYRTPLDYGTAVTILARLALLEVTGILHVAGYERMSRYDLMQRAAVSLDIDPKFVKFNRRHQVILKEPRPHDVSLDTSRLRSILPQVRIPSVEDALNPA